MRRTLTVVLFGAAILPGAAAGQDITAIERAKAADFDMKGEIACAQEVGEAMGACRAAVARAGGAAAVVVTFPNGFARTLTFDGGDFVRGNATMSGVGTDTDWSLSDGTYFVRVDDQRYEVPAALVFGE
ncbi:MAG: hypothetical protein KJO42_15975 [Silicimonas sp.]|nr:hypothetical protein [Silicimonas sp.]